MRNHRILLLDCGGLSVFLMCYIPTNVFKNVLAFCHICTYDICNWIGFYFILFVSLLIFKDVFATLFFLFYEIFISMINSQLFNLAIVCVPFLYHLQTKHISHTFSPNLFILSLIAYGPKINLL